MAMVLLLPQPHLTDLGRVLWHIETRTHQNRISDDAYRYGLGRVDRRRRPRAPARVVEEELNRRLYCLKQFAKTATSLIQVRLTVWRCMNSVLARCLRAWTSKNGGKDVSGTVWTTEEGTIWTP